MTAVELLQITSWALFLLLAFVAIVDAIRRPRRATIDTARFFGAAALTILAATLGGAARLSSHVQGAISGSFAMALPYLLVRLVDDFANLPPLVPSFALAGLVLAVAALFALPAPLLAIVTLLLVLYFIGLTTYASFVVVREARRTRGVTRRRMEAIAAGSLFLGLAILWAGLQALAPRESGLWAVLSQVSGIAYFLGFATPPLLRRAWQEPEVRSFLRTAAGLAQESDVAASVKTLEESAAVALGVLQASIGIWDPDAGVLRFRPGNVPPQELPPGEMVSGRAFAAGRPVFSDDPIREEPRHAERYRDAGVSAVLAAPMAAGGARSACWRPTPRDRRSSLRTTSRWWSSSRRWRR